MRWYVYEEKNIFIAQAIAYGVNAQHRGGKNGLNHFYPRG